MLVKRLRVFCAVCVTLGFFMAFSSGAAAAAPKKITFMDCQFDSQMVHNEIAKFIVENGFDGYSVEFVTGSPLLLWQAMLVGDIDVDIEEWPDNVGTYDEDVARGDVIPLGILVPDSAQGIYVPRYVIEGDPERGIKPMAPDLKHVKDLPKYSHLFKDPDAPSRGRIFGGIPGWMSEKIMAQKYLFYKLNEGYNYCLVGNEAMMYASLVSAYNLGDPWVGYLYEPSWITGKLDMVMLEDEPYDPQLLHEGTCAFPSQALTVCVGKHFPEKAPELLDFFKKYQTGRERINAALAYLEDTQESHTQTAIWFLKKHDFLLDEWLTPAQAKKVRDALVKF